MSRRGASVGCMRRVTRWGTFGAAGGGGEPTVAEILAALGADARSWWTCYDPTLPADPGLALSNPGSGDVVDSFTDQLGSRTVPAPGAANRPPYAPDPGFFGGRPVVQLGISGGVTPLILRTTAGVASMGDVGEHPYFLVVMRNRVAPVGERRMWELSTLTFITPVILRMNLGGGQGYSYYPQAGAAQQADAAASSITQQPAVVACWSTSGGGSFISINDGAPANNPAGTGAITNALVQICFGSNRTGQLSTTTESSLAEFISLAQYPGDAIHQQLVAAERAKWGF